MTLVLTLVDFTQAALSSDALPTSAPVLAAYSIAQFQLFADDAEFTGALTSLTCVAGCTAAVGDSSLPEPSVLPLALIGLGAIALRARRNGRSTI